MFGWSDLRFLRVVSRTGSTVAAACALGVNRTKVARRINALEIGGPCNSLFASSLYDDVDAVGGAGRE